MENDAHSDLAQSVSIKAPPFLESSVPSWFLILEAQFKIKKVTDDTTKFYHAISSLPPEVVSRLNNDCIQKESFIGLKTAVIEVHERSKPELFEKLISTTRMTGRPSLFLQELNQIAQKVGIGEELVRHKFIQALPPAISPVLASQKALSIEQLGSLADELQPFAQDQTPIYNTRFREASPRREQRREPFRLPFGLRPFSNNQKPVVCRGHLYFGNKSKTCKPWCRWPNKNAANLRMQPSSRPTSPTLESNPTEN